MTTPIIIGIIGLFVFLILIFSGIIGQDVCARHANHLMHHRQVHSSIILVGNLHLLQHLHQGSLNIGIIAFLQRFLHRSRQFTHLQRRERQFTFCGIRSIRRHHQGAPQQQRSKHQ